MDGEIKGTKIVEFGPIRVGVEVRKKLERGMKEGNVKVKGKISDEGNKGREEEVEIKMELNNITFKDKNNNTYRFQYTSQSPKVQLHPRQPTKLLIKFSNSPPSQLISLKSTLFLSSKPTSSTLQLSLNRQERDYIYLAHKCFLNQSISIIHLLQLLNNPNNINQIISLKNYVNDLQHINKRLMSENKGFNSQMNQNKLKKNFSSSVVTVMTEGDFLQKVEGFKSERQKMVKRIKGLEIDNMRLSQRDSLVKTNRSSLENQKGKVKELQQENKKIKKELKYLKKMYKELSQDTVLSDFPDSMSYNNTLKKSSLKFQGESISHISLNFGSRISHTSLNNQFQSSQNPLFKPNTNLIQLSHLNQTIKLLSLQLQTSQNTYTLLSLQNNKLKSTILSLQSQLKSHQHSIKSLQNNLNTSFSQSKIIEQKKDRIVEEYQGRIEELKEEIELIERGQEVVNRSREIGGEEMRVLKEQNRILLEENQRLAKICERYLGEAKEGTRMRGEIIRLNREMMEMKEKGVIQ